jgi:peptide/nickel transport system substrate-binding protein
MFKSIPKLVPITSLVIIAVMTFAACVVPPTQPGGSAANPQPMAAPAMSEPAAEPVTSYEEVALTTDAQGPSTTVKNPNTLVEASIGDPESLDPAWAYDTASGEVILNVYETLVFPNQTSATEFVPLLASKWDISPDGMTYTFTLRSGIKFQDGGDLMAEDVAYSFWRGMIQDRAGGPQWIMMQPFFGLDVQSFQDDVVTKQFNGDWTKAVQALQQAITYDNQANTVTLHLKQPYGPMLQILSGTWASVVSKAWVTKQGGWDGTPATAEKYHDPSAEQDELFKIMNGTGPYKLDRWVPSQEVDLVRNDNYWLKESLWQGGPTGPAKTERAIIKIVSEWGTRFAMLQTGDADIAYVPQQYISQVEPLVKETCDATGKCTETNPNGRLRLAKGLPTVLEDTIFFNELVNTTGGNSRLGSGVLDGNGIPPDFFSDIHVRKAFNYCFDWKTYITQVWNGDAEQALGPIINGLLGFNPDQAHYSYDPAQCEAEFKASTLKSPDGKSLWDVGFYMQYTYNTGNDQRRSAGDILQADLAKVNPKFKLSIVDEPFPVFLKDQVAGRMPIFMLGWQEDYHDPQDWVTPYLASGGTYGGTQHFPADLQAQMDKLIAQGVSTTNTQERAKIYEQLQNLAYENALDIFVVQRVGRHYEQMWVNGWYYNPTYPGSPETGSYFYVLSKGG